MLASCLMPTYNRLQSTRFGDCSYLVDEAVECFLRQTYPHKELIICNDCPEHTYEFDHPQVRVLNLPVRLRSLGEKMNFLAAVAQGDLLFRWDDDDISLPGRLTEQVQRLQKHQFVKPKEYFYAERGQIVSQAPANHVVAAFHRRLFDEVGGYPHLTEYEDHIMDKRLSSLGTGHIYDQPLSELWYIYRWASGTEHLSGYTTGGTVGRDSWAGAATNTPLPGRHVIQPHWRHHYVDLAARFVAAQQQQQ